jgi:hypothetical protein
MRQPYASVYVKNVTSVDNADGYVPLDLVHDNATLIIVAHPTGKLYVFRTDDIVNIFYDKPDAIDFQLGAKLMDYIVQQNGSVNGKLCTQHDVVAQIEWYVEHFHCNHEAYEDHVRVTMKELANNISKIVVTKWDIEQCQDARSLCEKALIHTPEACRLLFCGDYGAIELHDGEELKKQ